MRGSRFYKRHDWWNKIGRKMLEFAGIVNFKPRAVVRHDITLHLPRQFGWQRSQIISNRLISLYAYYTQ